MAATTNIIDLIPQLEIKNASAKRPEQLLYSKFLMIQKTLSPNEECVILQEPGGEFSFIVLPDGKATRIQILREWQSKSAFNAEYEQLTISIPEAVVRDDLYRTSKAIYYSVIDSFPDKEIVAAVFHLNERYQAPHYHFLLKKT